MPDLYTKAVLTVIATALVTIAGQMWLHPAQAQLSDLDCGVAPSRPCYVETADHLGISVFVTNWPRE